MKKYMLLLALLVTSPLLGQERSEAEIENEIKQLSSELKVLQKEKALQKENIKFDLKKQHWFSVFTRMDAVWFREFGSVLPVSTSGIEFFLGKKVYFYGRLDFYFELGHDSKVSYQGGIGGVFGVGGYLLNDRDIKTGKGWSVMLNGGISVKGALFSNLYPSVSWEKYGPNPYRNFLEIGAEINLKGLYNVHKNLAIAIGPHMAYHGLGVGNYTFGIQTGLVF